MKNKKSLTDKISSLRKINTSTVMKYPKVMKQIAKLNSTLATSEELYYICKSILTDKEVISILSTLYEKKLISYPRSSTKRFDLNRMDTLSESMNFFAYDISKQFNSEKVFNLFNKENEYPCHLPILPIPFESKKAYKSLNKKEKLVYKIIVLIFRNSFL